MMYSCSVTYKDDMESAVCNQLAGIGPTQIAVTCNKWGCKSAVERAGHLPPSSVSCPLLFSPLHRKAKDESWGTIAASQGTLQTSNDDWPGGRASGGGGGWGVTVGPRSSGAPPSPSQEQSERPGGAANPRESAKRDHHHVGQVAAARKSSPPWLRVHQHELLRQISAF